MQAPRRAADGSQWRAARILRWGSRRVDLFGLRQVWLYFRGHPYEVIGFRTPALYRYVRHPLYVGWLMVFWGAPEMTVAHLVFSIATSAYILIAIQFEERDLARLYGEYAEYRRSVPMLVPISASKQRQAAERKPKLVS